MLKFLYILIYTLLLCSSFCNAQNSASVKNTEFGLILSLKSGYHSGYKENLDGGFPGGLVFDASLDVAVGRRWFVCAMTQFWYGSSDMTSPQSNYTSITDYNGSEFALGVRTRSQPNTVSFLFGLSIGRYSINTSSSSGGLTKYYTSFSIYLGAEWYLSKRFAIGADAVYKGLVSFESGAGLWQIRLGPSFNFN